MPIYDLACSLCDYEEPDRYFKVRKDDYGDCPKCGGKLLVRLGLSNPLVHTFAEDREYTDLHIRPDGKPQRITSWGQRQRLMREFNLEDPGVKRGMKGCWA